jgi:hypothetical protein
MPIVSRVRAWQILIVLGGVGALVCTVVPIAAWIYFSTKFPTSKILDFNPTSFSAKADSRFFYSIDTELKSSDSIDSKAPTLFKGRINAFLVSPDNTKIAFVSDQSSLMIIDRDGSVQKVTPVASIFPNAEAKMGQGFFRNDNFQWSRDSRSLYLIHDQYHETEATEISRSPYSNHGELWRYDLNSRQMKLVLKPFKADTYFFDSLGQIYFWAQTDSGPMQLKFFDGKKVSDVDPHSLKVDSPFYSFSEPVSDHYFSKGVRYLTSEDDNQRLWIDDKPYIAVTLGVKFIHFFGGGSYYCLGPGPGLFLPGNRYYVLNVWCGNYSGQLLIDKITGEYQRLPSTRVYRTTNTAEDQDYEITENGIDFRY